MILTLAVNGSLVTHRLVGFGDYGTLITQGDANAVVDDWTGASITVVGVYRARIPYLGYLAALPGQLLQGAFSGAWFSAAAELPGEISAASPEPATPTETVTPTATVTETPPASPSGTSLAAAVTALGYLNAGSPTWGVTGQLCATNTGAEPTLGLTATVQVEYKTGSGPFAPLPEVVLALPLAGPLAPNAQACWDYDLPFTPLPQAQYRLVALVTVLNHSGWLPGGPRCAGPEPCPFGPEPKTEFALPEASDAAGTNPTPPPLAATPLKPGAVITPNPPPTVGP
jgi:hypothetical protein